MRFVLRAVSGLLAFCLATAAAAHPFSDASISAASARIASRPGDPSGYLWRAEEHFAAGHLAEAETDLVRARALDPDRIEVATGLMAIAARFGDLERAARLLDQFRDAHPDRQAELEERTAAVLHELELGWVDGAALRPLREHLATWPDVRAQKTAAPDPADPSTVLVTRGPYLMSASPTSIVVRWRTSGFTKSWVWLGDAPGVYSDWQGNNTLTVEHEVLVEGLSPNTRYYYGVGTNLEVLSGGDAETYLTTAPLSGAAHPSRIWILGDSGFKTRGARAVRDAFFSWNAGAPLDFMMLLGDNAYQAGTDADYQEGLFDMYPAALRRMTVWPTRGNHDVLYAGDGNDYYDFFTLPTLGQCGGAPSGSEAYYSFDWGRAHFICLDSEGSDRTPAGPMLTWLEQDLAQDTSDWTICFWHHPPYTKGSHDSDDPADSDGKMIEMRGYTLPILDSFGVDLVLGGHSHGYERSFLLNGHYGYSWTLAPQMILDGGDGDPAGDGAYDKGVLGPTPHSGAVYAVMGSASTLGDGTYDHPVMVTSQRRLASELLTIDGGQLEVSMIDSFGVVMDHFVMVKNGSASVEPPDLGTSSAGRAAPNPFASEVRLRFELPAAGPVKAAVHDASGRRVRNLYSGFREAGSWTIVWDGRDDAGRLQPPGVYFGTVDQGPRRLSERIVRVD